MKRLFLLLAFLWMPVAFPSTNVVINGTTYAFPVTGDQSWGDSVTNWAVAVSNSLLQKTGGTFTLTADVDFGASFGLKSPYYKSRSSSVGTTGVFRLANTEVIGWRNAANSGNLPLTVNSSDILTYNGVPVLTAASSLLPTTGGGTGLSSWTAGDLPYYASGTALSKLGIGTSAYLLKSTGTAPSWGLLLNANVDPSAAIAYSKLSLTGSLVNSDVSGSAAIAYSKLSLGTSIVNSDISTSAAIALSKLATTTVSRALVSDSGGLITASPTTATELGYVNGVTSAIQTQINAKQASAIAPTIQKFIITGTTTGYRFTITSGSATVGATYTNNSNTYTVLGTIASQTTLFCSQASAPSGSGTLTKATGSGDATIAFSSSVPLATYTTPSSPAPLYIRVRISGGGAGGAGSSTLAASDAVGGFVGKESDFGAGMLVGSPGTGGVFAANNTGGVGGAASLGTGPIGTAFSGGDGGGYGSTNTASAFMPGGDGGSNIFGGRGGGGKSNTAAGAGSAGKTNTGAGGGGASSPAQGLSGGGGGAGGFADAIISAPAGSYPYIVGTGGNAGTAGTSGAAGGAGAAGYIEVTEHYQ